MIFDEIERTSRNTDHSQTLFDRLNHDPSSNGLACRAAVESWFEKYPIEAAAEMRSRIRSNIDVKHQSALFELYLHEILCRMGCIVAVHPSVEGSVRLPDFLVTDPNGSQFYAEAVLATGESAAQAAGRIRLNNIYDGLNRMIDSPDFFLGVTIRSAPKGAPSIKRMARFLDVKLKSLDYNSILEAYKARRYHDLPTLSYVDGDWSLDFQPVPKINLRGNSEVRPLGFWSIDPGHIRPEDAIRGAVKLKSSRYGQFGLPYIIAVNCLDIFADETSEEQALFGDHAVYMNPNVQDGRNDVRFVRKRNGIWCGRERPTHTRVSGVLVAQMFGIWKYAETELRLYLNPWGSQPYNSVLTLFTRRVLSGDQIHTVEGAHVRDIFDT